MNDIPLLDPLLLSLRVAALATLFSSLGALLLAWKLSRRRGPLPAVLDAFCALPLVLPPTVVGYYLIVLLGRHGLVGRWLAEAGISLIFSWQGAVVAATVVVFPLIYKSARAALEQVDSQLEDAARTLGAGEWRIFLTISLPLAWRGIFAGIMLAFARGMGEFGATLMLAGNIPGRTQTLALAIYDAFQAGNDARATLLVLVASGLCMGLLAGAELLMRLRRRRRAVTRTSSLSRQAGGLPPADARGVRPAGMLRDRRPAC
ncbi:molybdate ABC transporter permease subunit [uncultured Desulfovibrio sp.]|uniref:molybdate ABC transporter permease subunit n=1 Tax=uncultured Desulfovibrio sp. TaxID=167968 RepID=UPI002613D3AB|nr:molybdate ABC transporter permease subunit [uncultured Desulfovibrio sp.]